MFTGRKQAINTLLSHYQGVLSGEIGEKVWGAMKDRLMAHLLNDYRELLKVG